MHLLKFNKVQFVSYAFSKIDQIPRIYLFSRHLKAFKKNFNWEEDEKEVMTTRT
mgnify:CR=1 FL=1